MFYILILNIIHNNLLNQIIILSIICIFYTYINYSVITDNDANKNNLQNYDIKHPNILINTVLYALYSDLYI